MLWVACIAGAVLFQGWRKPWK